MDSRLKRILCFSLTCCLVLCSRPALHASTHALDPCEYEANDEDDYCGPLGYATDTATFKTVAMSMVGWGLGLAALIAILAGVISQSTHVHSDSTSDSSSTSGT